MPGRAAASAIQRRGTPSDVSTNAAAAAIPRAHGLADLQRIDKPTWIMRLRVLYRRALRAGQVALSPPEHIEPSAEGGI